MFFRSFFLQAGWNYVKYQNLGFALVMLPFLRRLYRQDPEALPSVMNRYLEAFNTHPVMASFCFGAMARMEESVARAQSVADYKEQVAEWMGRGLFGNFHASRAALICVYGRRGGVFCLQCRGAVCALGRAANRLRIR